jgi:hypothetical protein
MAERLIPGYGAFGTPHVQGQCPAPPYAVATYRRSTGSPGSQLYAVGRALPAETGAQPCTTEAMGSNFLPVGPIWISVPIVGQTPQS